jgi:hypothetical protein
MNLTFFSVTQFRYGNNSTIQNEYFLNVSNAISIIILIVIIIYTILRTVYNPIAGIYCIKKFCIGIILACTFNSEIIALFFLIEMLFILARLIFEGVMTKL